MIEQFYLLHKWDPNNTSQSGPGSNANERVLHILQSPGLESHYQMQFSAIHKTLVGREGLTPLRGTVGVFYSPRQPDGEHYTVKRDLFIIYYHSQQVCNKKYEYAAAQK